MTPTEIKAARLDLGFTQEMLAEATGVSRGTIIGWERGYHPAPYWFSLAVAAVAGRLGPYLPSEFAMAQAEDLKRIKPAPLTPSGRRPGIETTRFAQS